MKRARDFEKIYLYRPFVDMRRSFNGLCSIVEGAMAMNPGDGSLFVFINRDRITIKALYWDNSGFAIWHKRLEREKFQWLKHCQGDYLSVSPEQLDWLLTGFDIEMGKPHEKLSFAAFS